VKTFTLYWAPEGRRIATVQARDERAAKRKTPQPYRKYLGEIYARDAVPCALCGQVIDDGKPCGCGAR
jgi:hypothetical protein